MLGSCPVTRNATEVGRPAMLSTIGGMVTARSAAFIVGVVMLVSAMHAQAVPSFARQTGIACEGCHTVFPELTPFGRKFKMNGYLIDNLVQIKAETQKDQQSLALNWMPPLSVP